MVSKQKKKRYIRKRGPDGRFVASGSDPGPGPSSSDPASGT
ncbi:hypothetical protein PC129_g6682 [Phytophthora cactorum]|uniref:Uncharacterized protein n=1 Tax=Phytophthora cactorum TaxID=29920 RepID=A0A8T1GDF0_9STRA|nr:hypothetical protein Pcac1_g901 [Phytophthora cactorum]KAG2829997.1 hypothetical protein PC111_g7536 [Phytophthora cactorum]KAG2837055.1 hypothetical protein PC112_g5049 [Phytophthora cactorum]KAG2859444.1 hypothetical protein PC113_g8928 [Phytophthora cactorum]KAG2911791.1 hypothetical protein PC117_g19058 [Phytophthora cactorum]